jgi:hypothetical protein
MRGSLEDILGSLERLSTEMAGTEGPPLDALIKMIARRQALVERIAAFEPLDPAVRERLERIVRMGALIGSRLNAARESLRREIENMGRVQRFAGELGHTLPSRAPRLNTRG